MLNDNAWLIIAIELVMCGSTDKLTRDNVTVYRVEDIIRVDIKDPDYKEN